MKRKIGFLIALVAMLSMLLVPAGALAVEPPVEPPTVEFEGIIYTNGLNLENKISGGVIPWPIIDTDTIGGTLGYNASGDTFEWALQAKVSATGEYVLIYYADFVDRFIEWGGNNPGEYIATVTADVNCNISTSGSKTTVGDFPRPYDANEYEISYSGEYSNHHGAKIWLVPIADYDTVNAKLTAWNPDSYLFETDLIWYRDSEPNSDDIVSISVTPNVNFGQLIPGTTATGTVTVTTTGNIPTDLGALAVTGDVFASMTLDGFVPTSYSFAELGVGQSTLPIVLSFVVPEGYQGTQNGTLTFTATGTLEHTSH